MSDILNSVALSYHHDVLGVLQAQDRLRSFDREGAYLLRESDVRPGFFVLSLFKDSSMLHLAVPDKNGKFLRQTLEEACKVVEDIVNSCDEYIHPVPAHSIASNLNDNESGGVQDGTKCYYIPADSLQFMIPVCGNTRDSTSPILISAVRGTAGDASGLKWSSRITRSCIGMAATSVTTVRRHLSFGTRKPGI